MRKISILGTGAYVLQDIENRIRISLQVLCDKTNSQMPELTLSTERFSPFENKLRRVERAFNPKL